MNKSYTKQEMKELKEIQAILYNHRSVFNFPPEVNKTLTSAYWNLLKSLNATIPYLECVFQSFIGKTPRYPSIMEVKEAIQLDPNWVNPTLPEKTYDIVSAFELNSCEGDIELITRKYVSGLLFHKCNKHELDIFILSITENQTKMPILYELSYLKLHRQGIDLIAPEPTIKDIWKFEIMLQDRERFWKEQNFNIREYVKGLSEKMSMGGNDGK